MSKRTFVDTQFVVALVNQRDQLHARALKLADEMVGQQLLTTDAVVIEIGNALARSFRSEAVDVIDRFLNSGDVEVVHTTPATLLDAFELYRTRADKSWGMTDCISFVAMRRANVQDALTCDQHFTQAGFVTLLAGA